MDSTRILKASFLDILFDERNKSYGAYELRNHYDRRVRNAVMITSSIVLVLIGGYVVSNGLKAAVDIPKPFVAKPIVMNEIDLPPDPVIPPPVAEAAPPPAAATRIFTPPVLTTEEVPEDVKPPRQEELQHVAIGTQNIEGMEDGIPADLADGNKISGTAVAIEKGNGKDEGPLITVEINPEFPGGESALMKYLQKNTKYPSMAMENGIQGTVFIQFVVNKDGSITDVKTVGAPKGGGLEDEATRVVRNMPKWKPGRQNGRNVAVFFNLPISFHYNEQ